VKKVHSNSLRSLQFAPVEVAPGTTRFMHKNAAREAGGDEPLVTEAV
jgi:hypothetical protein